MTVKELMAKGYTEEEAISLKEWDERIDHMTMKELNAEISAEEKAARKAVMNSLGTREVKKDADKKPAKRERKADLTKQGLIKVLAEALAAAYPDAVVDVTNPEKLIAVALDGENFEVDLKKKRKAKA